MTPPAKGSRLYFWHAPIIQLYEIAAENIEALKEKWPSFPQDVDNILAPLKKLPSEYTAKEKKNIKTAIDKLKEKSSDGTLPPDE